jgi:hypothetical protein
MKLAAATPASEPLPDTMRSAFDRVRRDDLRADVERIAVPRVFGTPENEAVRKTVAERMADALKREDDSIEIGVDNAGNVIAGDPRRARVLIGAHYDAVSGTPGADDNASAVAILLAAARAIGLRADVSFVAFNGEECGFVGSRALVKSLSGCRPEQVHVLEMVGFTAKGPDSQQNPIPMVQTPNIGDFLGLVGTHNSARVLDRVLNCAGYSGVPVYGLYLPDLPFDLMKHVVPHVFRSDHAPFWSRYIPALMWTDTAEFRNPNYHQTSDTPDTLDYGFMAEVTRLLAHVVLSSLGAVGR